MLVEKMLASQKHRLKATLDNTWGSTSEKLKKELKQKRESEFSEEVESKKLDVTLDVRDTGTSLEFLLCTLSNKFSLPPAQVFCKDALGLLAQDKKYLISILIKGIRGNFTNVVNWYKEVYTHADLLAKLLERETDPTNSTIIVLDIIKAGFYSKSAETALWTCRLLSQLATIFAKSALSGTSWEWFIAENGGLAGLLHCYQKNHHLIAESAISVMCQFGEHCFVELFTYYLKVFSKDNAEYLQLVTVFIQPLSEYKPSRDQVTTQGVLENWLDFACQKAEPQNQDQNEKAAALGLLVEAWLCFYGNIEENSQYAEMIVKLLQRANRDRNYAMQFMSISLQFKLLDLFALEKDPYAPIIYKTLTFALIENQGEGIREFMLGNFKHIFDKFTTIPIGILLDPLIRYIRSTEGATFFYNLFDFDFFRTISKHPRLSLKHAIQTLDILAKVLLHDSLYTMCAAKPFFYIMERFKHERALAGFLAKMLKYSLRIYCTNMVNHNIRYDEKEHEPIILLQNEVIIDVVYRVLQFNNETLTNFLRETLFDANSYIRTMTKSDNPRLVVLLQNIDPNLPLTPPNEEVKETVSEDLNLAVPLYKSDKKIKLHLPKLTEEAIPELSYNEEYAEKSIMKSHKNNKASETLRKQLQQRKAQLNEASKNMLEMEENLIFEEYLHNSKNDSNKLELEINWLNPEEEEEKDVEIVRSFIIKHAEFFHVMYSRYATIKPPSKVKTVKISDVWRMLKDYTIPAKILSPSEVAYIFKLVCLKSGQRNDALGITVEQFKELFVQLAIFAFRNSEFLLKTDSVKEKLELLLSQFKEPAKLRNDKEILSALSNKQNQGRITKELEAYVKLNPFYPLPEGYRKIDEKILIENYRIPSYLDVKPSIVMAVGIIDEILLENFGFHILEPITTYDYIPRIVPKMEKFRSPESMKHFMLPIAKKTNRNFLSPEMMKLQAKGRSQNMSKSPDPYLSMAKSHFRTNNSKSRNDNNSSMALDQSPMINVLPDKNKKQIIEETKKQRELYMKQEMEQKRKEVEENRLRQERERKKLEEKRQKLVEQRKCREIMLKQQQEALNKLEQEKQKAKAEELKTLKKKKQDQFKKDIQNIKEMTMKVVSDKQLKEKAEEAKRQKQREIINKRIRQEKERKEILKKQKIQLMEHTKKDPVKTILLEHSKQLKQIYDFMLRLTTKIDPAFVQNFSTLDDTKFLRFCVFFHLVPDLLTPEDAVGVFKDFMKAKAMLGNVQSPANTQAKISQVYPELSGATYQDFKEILVKLAVMLMSAQGKKLDLENLDGQELPKLLKYMKINKTDEKAALNVRLNLMKTEAEKQRITKAKGKALNKQKVRPLKTSSKKIIGPDKKQQEEMTEEEEEEEEEGEEYEDEEEENPPAKPVT